MNNSGDALGGDDYAADLEEQMVETADLYWWTQDLTLLNARTITIGERGRLLAQQVANGECETIFRVMLPISKPAPPETRPRSCSMF